MLASNWSDKTLVSIPLAQSNTAGELVASTESLSRMIETYQPKREV